MADENNHDTLKTNIETYLSGLYIDNDDILECLGNTDTVEDDFEEDSSDPASMLMVNNVTSLGASQHMQPIHPHVKKKLMNEGVFGTLKADATILMHIEVYALSNMRILDSSIKRKRPDRAQLGDGSLLEGIEVALLSMRLKETSHFRIDWQAMYGELGCEPRIPRRADVFVAIHVVKVFEQEIRPETFEGALSITEELLRQAKNEFVERPHGRCWKTIRHAQDILENSPVSDETQVAYDKMMTRLHYTLAGMHNHTNRPEAAIVHAREALQIDKSCRKALVSIIKAHIHLQNYDQADRFLKRASTLYPDDQKIKTLHESLHERRD